MVNLMCSNKLFNPIFDMPRIFDGRLQVHYGQAYVMPSDQCGLDLNDAFRGQVNGLCGAATKGSLFLTMGLHTGTVVFTLDVVSAAPAIDERWEEIVEVPFVVGERAISLVKWEEGDAYPIPLAAGLYRARYCARNMDQGHDFYGDGDSVDSYYLVLWPASEVSSDCVIKQTSEVARYWHEYSRKLDN